MLFYPHLQLISPHSYQDAATSRDLDISVVANVYQF